MEELIIDSPWVIICEGAGDAAFFRHLIDERKIPKFFITYPNHVIPTAQGGRDGFTRRLKAIRTLRGFSSVTDLIIVSDNDDDPQANFEKVQELIEATEYLTVPDKPETTAGANPRVSIYMFPQTDVKGQLETLCLESCGDAWPKIAECLDGFEKCNQAHFQQWPEEQKKEKMRMRVMISSLCSEDPYTSLVHAWSRKVKMIPLDHACFDGIAAYLNNVATSGNLPLATR